MYQTNLSFLLDRFCFNVLCLFMTTITQKRTTKTMAEAMLKGLLNLCFIPHPFLQNHPKISIINCFDADQLTNVEMLVMTKKNQNFRFFLLSKCWTKMNFLSVFLHARDRRFVKSEYVTDK